MPRVNVLPNGRLVLPAEMRRQLGVDKGGQLIATMQDGVVRLTTVDQSLDEACALYRQYASEGPSVVDDLIEDRRAEAAREAKEGGTRSATAPNAAVSLAPSGSPDDR